MQWIFDVSTGSSINGESQDLVTTAHQVSCPVCEENYSLYSSWTRHLKKHQTITVQLKLQCSECEKVYESRKAISTHYSKTHGAVHTDRSSTTSAGNFQCDFCDKYFPSKANTFETSMQLRQVMRNLEASQLPPSRHWSKQEHALFLEALQQVGPTSNIKISRIVGTKTAAQVGRHKRIFLHDHPGKKTGYLITCCAVVTRSCDLLNSYKSNSWMIYTSPSNNNPPATNSTILTEPPLI